MLEKATAYGIYLAYIDEYLKELDEDSVAIFNAAGIADPAALPLQERIEVETLAEVVRSVNRHTHRSSFFLELGARIPLMAHGNLGSAIMACKDARTIMHVIERFAAIVLPAVHIALRETGSEAVAEYQISTPFPELNIALVEALISTTTYNLSLLTGQPFHPRKVSVTFKQPSHWERYRQFTHCDVEFNADSNSMHFAQSQLDWPIRTANALNQRVMLAQCEDELKQVQSRTQLTDRIREIISLYLDASPSIGFVAEKLRLSERTLRRRLNEEGINFRDLLKEIRHETALYFLGKTDLRIDNIARQLGYSETANFRKAFKEQCGQSPRQWRESARGAGADP
ncbi:MAG TPA: AraC family transcriptional regulator ligand-binding domain-containing protein [Dongiaceae bacterium]|nr:AraC family transcriptional regulator ligand-binding domain-containing protein [Dongiaceae bacterium]